jgi:hypothetical protein
MSKTSRSSQPHLETHKPHPLLVKRRAARQMLGEISNSQIIRMEKPGGLKPIKLSRSPLAATFYAYENVLEVARGQST